MADEEEGPQYQWTSLEAPPEGQEEPLSSNWVKVPGRAKSVYPNGDTFEGAFNDAREKHGRGVYVWSTQAGANPWVPEEGFPEDKAPSVRYEGQYVEGKKQGVGKITFPNGDRYHGMWEADKFHGEGTYYYSNGDIYSGNWEKGVKQGQGVFLSKRDGSQLVGDWSKGSFVSGKWVWKDGTSWHGPFKAGKPLGRGVFYFPNGTMQEGEYIQEGDEEEPDAENLKYTWKGEGVKQANASSHEILRNQAVVA